MQLNEVLVRNRFQNFNRRRVTRIYLYGPKIISRAHEIDVKKSGQAKALGQQMSQAT